MSHTQGKLNIHPSSIDAEPFVVASETQGEYIAFSQWIADGKKIICDVSMNTAKGGWPKVESVSEAKANARRLVACWNACEGMTTEEIESGKVKFSKIIGLLSQRNELLEQMQAIAVVAHAGGLANMSELDALVVIRKLTLSSFDKNQSADQARAAIQKAEGKV